MSTLVLVSLIVFLAAIVLGLALAGWKALALWRAFKRFRRTVQPAVRETNAQLVQLETRAAGLSEHATRVERARAQLEGSLAEARVLMAGAQEVAAAVQAVRSLMPSR